MLLPQAVFLSHSPYPLKIIFGLSLPMLDYEFLEDILVFVAPESGMVPSGTEQELINCDEQMTV